MKVRVPFPVNGKKARYAFNTTTRPTGATDSNLGGGVFVEYMPRLTLMDGNKEPSLNGWLEMVRC